MQGGLRPQALLVLYWCFAGLGRALLVHFMLQANSNEQSNQQSTALRHVVTCSF